MSGSSRLTLAQDLNVANDLTIQATAGIQRSNSSAAAIKVSGDVTSNDSDYLSTSSSGNRIATVALVGAGDQTLTGNGAQHSVNVSKTGGDVLLPANFIVRDGGFSGSGAIKNTSGTETSGRLVFGGNNVSTSFTGTIDDLYVNQNQRLTLSADLNVTNDLTIQKVQGIQRSNSSAAAIKVSGDVTSNDSDYLSTSSSGNRIATVALVGAGDQTLTGNGALHYLDIDKSGGGDVLMPAFNRNFVAVTVSSGEWDVLGNTVTATSGFTAHGGAIAGSGTLNGNLTLNSGSALNVGINGDTPVTQHDQLVVNGAVAINGAALTGTTGAAPSGSITIVANDGTTTSASGSSPVRVPRQRCDNRWAGLRDHLQRRHWQRWSF